MNTKEYEDFIQRIYNAGENNADAIKEMNEFVKRPGTLQLIMDSISSHEISRLAVLISLKCIPNVSMTEEDYSALSSWFIDYVFKDSDNLISDDFLALLVDVFLFTFRDDNKAASTLIQDLSEGTESQKIISLQMALRSIEKSETILNPDFLIPMSIYPFTNNESSPPLIDSACLLLIQLLTSKKIEVGRKELRLNVIRAGIEAHFPRRIFKFLSIFSEQDEIFTINLLKLFNAFLSFPPSFFPTQKDRNLFILNSVVLFFDYVSFGFDEESGLQSLNISEKKIPIFCSIFLSLKKSSSVLIKEDSLDPTEKVLVSEKKMDKKRNIIYLYDDLIIHASILTQYILSFVEYLDYFELILDFWILKDIYTSRTNHKTENEEIIKLQTIIQKKFFSEEVIQIEEKISEILADRSSTMIKKMAKFSELTTTVVQEDLKKLGFGIISACEVCCTFLVNELNPQNLEIAAFLIKFLSYASDIEGTMPVFDKILRCVYEFQKRIEPRLSISFELSMIKFYRLLLKRFVEDYSDPLREFFIRFMNDIQTTEASIEVIQAVIKLLNSKKISERYMTIIAQKGEAFDLIVSSQIVSTPMEDQPKKVTVSIFQVAFQLGFLNSDPSQIMSLIELISERIKNNPNDSVSYLMMSGGFLAENCKFDSFCIALTNEFFPLLLQRLSEFVTFYRDSSDKNEEKKKEKDQEEKVEGCTNPNIVIDILHLFYSITSCFCKNMDEKDYLSTVVIEFSELTLKVINMILDVVEVMNKESLECLKVISLVSLILSNLLLNKALNFGVIEIYGNKTFQETACKLFDLYLTVSFESFAQNSKLVDRYLVFMNAVIGEYLTLFINIDNMTLQHHLQILISIFDVGDDKFSPLAIKLLTSLGESVYQYEIPEFEKKCSTALNCIIQKSFNLFLKRNMVDSLSCKLIYTFLMNFPMLRSNFFDTMIEKIESEKAKDELHFVFFRIKSSFTENNPLIALNLLEQALKTLIKYAYSNKIDLSL